MSTGGATPYLHVALLSRNSDLATFCAAWPSVWGIHNSWHVSDDEIASVTGLSIDAGRNAFVVAMANKLILDGGALSDGAIAFFASDAKQKLGRKR